MMARDILSIPITIVASELAFSIGGRIIDKYRSSIVPKNVEALLCTRDWLCGLRAEEDSLDDESLLVEDFQNIDDFEPQRHLSPRQH
ncbi:hypothetical protein L1049_012742 [Liquidambar formosana]|uniref:HAT C-terminal dimerisation domain-containing protein n=1 Tax=Liquidambar formosana TaxID=63359 RepID=A0AAP0WTM3_LIQFO